MSFQSDEGRNIIIAGHVRAEDSSDQEEQEQIRRMHGLMDEYGLDSQVRWLGMFLDKKVAGELYRRIADSRGAFVQPALFEAFGITVIEAMISGLPTFATQVFSSAARGSPFIGMRFPEVESKGFRRSIRGKGTRKA